MIDTAAAKRLGVGAVLIVFLFAGKTSLLRAQESVNVAPGNLVLLSSGSDPAAQPESSASLAGTVKDSQGVPIPELRLTLLDQKNSLVRAVTTDPHGDFLLSELPPGTYRVAIEAPGVAPYDSAALVLTVGQRLELPVTLIRVPLNTTTVDVNATLDQVAQAQVQQQEEQRIVGLLPNFYTSYIWDAAPLSRTLKFNLAMRTIFDPATFVVAGGLAGVEQFHKTFPGYGLGFEGYAKRYGASYADVVSTRMFSSAIFPVILHQDPRYFYRGSGSIRSRVLNAITSTIICRGDDGHLEPNYSRVLGSFAAAGLSNVYRASADRQASLTVRNGFAIIGAAAVENLLREFLSRKLTPNVPAFANGKP